MPAMRFPRTLCSALLALGAFVPALQTLAPDAPVPSRCEQGEEFSGGDTTVFDTSPKAFGFPAQNLREERRAAFFVGHSFFNENWVVAPASTAGRDGLGPLFNARSCSACHVRDGRGQPPAPGKPMTSMLIRLSIPAISAEREPRPEPAYGGQIQGQAIPGVSAEADVFVHYQEVPGTFADGEKYSLRKPIYSITNLNYGPLAANVMTSPRITPAMIGIGLLEAVPEQTLRSLADQQRGGSNGVVGRINYVWDQMAGRKVAGRFGWKAEQPTALQQIATAFVEDMGITSSLMPRENHTDRESACANQPTGGRPEINDNVLRDVVTYSRTLAVPGRRKWNDPVVLRGKSLFAEANCAVCHVPKLQTGPCADIPELSNQTIHPYTDLLLHDMGEALADNRPVSNAGGRDWRTAPLWGIGLVSKVNGQTSFLHDGRARDFAEAILWHGGEAEVSREIFRKMPKADRDALVAFLQSL